MRSRFDHCDGPLPFAPGSSPFHIKGEFYRQMLPAIAHHDEKSQGAVTAIIEREGLREFASQPFLSSALYDVLPMPRLVMAVAEARRRDVYELTSGLGQLAIEGQMQGLYGRFLQKISSATFCQRFDQVIGQFYDFGPLTLTPVERPGGSPAGARLVRRGMPLCVAEWWSLVTVPFAVVPLTASGARDVTVDWRIRAGAAVQGIAGCDVEWDVRWTAPA